MSIEIIKVDAEISELPEKDLRYIGFAKQIFVYDNNQKSISWVSLSDSNGLPWATSQEELVDNAVKMNEWDGYEIERVLILKAELPIKKLVLNE